MPLTTKVWNGEIVFSLPRVQLAVVNVFENAFFKALIPPLLETFPMVMKMLVVQAVAPRCGRVSNVIEVRNEPFNGIPNNAEEKRIFKAVRRKVDEVKESDVNRRSRSQAVNFPYNFDLLFFIEAFYAVWVTFERVVVISAKCFEYGRECSGTGFLHLVVHDHGFVIVTLLRFLD